MTVICNSRLSINMIKCFGVIYNRGEWRHGYIRAGYEKRDGSLAVSYGVDESVLHLSNAQFSVFHGNWIKESALQVIRKLKSRKVEWQSEEFTRIVDAVIDQYLDAYSSCK